jgi:hypothetical protein
MKYIASTLALLFLSISALALSESKKPVESITYKDGDVYTVSDSERVFITSGDYLWAQQTYSKSINYKKQFPTEKVDKPVPPVNPNPVGSKTWCENHDLHANGYTFDDQIWYRVCDTNSDGQYNICDYYEPTGLVTFEEIQWQDTCNDGKPWDGS